MDTLWHTLRLDQLARFGFRLLDMPDHSSNWCHFWHWAVGQPVEVGVGICSSLL